jgi:hypothetical protein
MIFESIAAVLIALIIADTWKEVTKIKFEKKE